jgi:hypothetical protein
MLEVARNNVAPFPNFFLQLRRDSIPMLFLLVFLKITLPKVAFASSTCAIQRKTREERFVMISAHMLLEAL